MSNGQAKDELDRHIRCVNVAMLCYSLWHSDKSLSDPSDQESIRILLELLGDDELLGYLNKIIKLSGGYQRLTDPNKKTVLKGKLSEIEKKLKGSIEYVLKDVVIKLKTLATDLKYCNWADLNFINTSTLVKGSIDLRELSILHHRMRVSKQPVKTDETNSKQVKLSEKTAAVLDLLKDLPPNRGLTGPEILKKLDDQHCHIDQSTLTKYIIPVLKKHYGVENQPRIGYYIEK